MLATEQDQVADLRTELANMDASIATLRQESRLAVENADHLQGLLHDREDDLTTYSQRLSSKEEEIAQLHDKLSSLTREHSRVTSEQSRTVSDITVREAEIRRQLEDAIRAKTEAQVDASSLRESLSSLQDDIEKLRRQVHELKKENADQDIKIVQMERQQEKDKVDNYGLNIALEAKQQELELVSDG